MTIVPTAECIFCRIVQRQAPAVVVYHDREMLAIMDRFPATPGHVLVLPQQHIETVYAMPGELAGRIMTVAAALAQAIKRQLTPDGINLIQANEAAAGQTVPHFHLHIVPRYRGDPVRLHFGHGTTPADTPELERLAARIRAGAAGEGTTPTTKRARRLRPR